MKIKYTKLLGILLLAIPGLIFLSCGDKEDIPPVDESSDLVIGEKQVEIVVGNKTELEIKAGNNEYKAFSLNEEIASVEIVGTKLVVEALELGRTSIIVSDAGSQYRTFDVVSYLYETVTVEHEAVDFSLRLGHTQTKTIDILEGNGNYRAKSSNPEIVSVVAEGDSLLVTGKKAGKASITVTDGIDFATTSIEVEVTTTTIPYDASELQEIKEQETLCYVLNNNIDKNEGSYYTLLNKVENERNLYGWDYWSFWYLKIYFAGDKTVGKKENASLIYNYSSTSISSDEVDLEIIKNDGEKIWATYSFIKDEKLNYGYFIQHINP